jgi:membrane fusion protein
MEGINENQTAVAARKLAVESQRRFVVRAPASGKIDLLLISPGRTTSAGEVQVSIAPVNAQLIAEAYFPSRSIGFVKVGQDARLAFDAFPPAKYGYAFGKVVAVANTPLDPADVPAAVRSDDPTYRVQVRLTQPFPRSSQSPLRPGMQLQAYLMLDNRRLWEALIRPILDTGR